MERWVSKFDLEIAVCSKVLFRAFWVALVLIFCQSALAQDVFTISTEPSPAQFYRSNPILHPRPDGGFMIAWQDFRNGTESFYAQSFDRTGQPVGENIELFSNELIAFGRDEQFLVVGHESFIFSIALAQLYGPSGAVKGPLELTRFQPPVDFFGCPAFGSFLASIPTGYLFADVFLGSVNILALDHDLSAPFTHPANALPGDARGFAMTTTRDGAYVLFWFGSWVEESEETKLYAKFFNPNHEVVADSVFLGDRWNTCRAVTPMQAVALQDSLYQLFFTTTDTLWHLTTDRSGKIVQEADFIAVGRVPTIPDDLSDPYTTLGISNVVDGTLFVFFNQSFSVPTAGGSQISDQTSVHEFGRDGKPGEFVVFSPPYHIRGHIHRPDQNHFQIALSLNNDIFLIRLDNTLTLTDSVKVNDDSLGSNQDDPVAIAAPKGEFLVLWRDEVSGKARRLDPGGSPLGDEFIPVIRQGQFFPNGDFLTTWTTHENRTYTVGTRIYSQDWQIIEERELAHRTAYRQLVKLATEVVDENLFLAFVQDSSELRLLKISRTNGILADTLVAKLAAQFLPVRITRDGDGLFWAIWQSHETDTTSMRSYDVHLVAASDLVSNSNVALNAIQFLPGGRYGFIEQDRTSGRYFLVVRDVAQQENLSRMAIGAGSAHSPQLTRLETMFFLIKWVEQGKLLLQAFDGDGAPIKDPFVAFTSPAGGLRDSRVVTNGSNALLTWADIVTPRNGFDILGSIVNTSTIVSVQMPASPIADFSLRQNYPNPFNPETSIQYEIRQPGQVALTIYNIMGQRVRTLVDTWQAAGRYRTVWDGRDGSGRKVASGVYVYKLNVDNQIFGKKMLLLR